VFCATYFGELMFCGNVSVQVFVCAWVALYEVLNITGKTQDSPSIF
jgi:hypothetical protein